MARGCISGSEALAAESESLTASNDGDSRSTFQIWVDKAESFATAIQPIVLLLTAIVQALTAWTMLQ